LLQKYYDGMSSKEEEKKLPEFFRYEITTPVTILRSQSAMVPILQEVIDCTKELVYNHVKTGKHPLNRGLDRVLSFFTPYLEL